MSKQAIESFFSAQEIGQLDPTLVPQHIAIIPDGNRRWAKSRKLTPEKGHMEGYSQVVKIVRAAKELGVKVITLFAFSTENWKRPGDEVEHLMLLTQEYLTSYQNTLFEEGIRLSAIGNIDVLPLSVKSILDKTIKKTQDCHDFDLVLAINYGGRDELVRAIKKVVANSCDAESITEQMISAHLDTNRWPDPDLIIRTSGEKRLSNFLLWQSSYAEVYIDDAAWPDFTPHHLLKAISDYQMRERRLGGSTKQ